MKRWKTNGLHALLAAALLFFAACGNSQRQGEKEQVAPLMTANSPETTASEAPAPQQSDARKYELPARMQHVSELILHRKGYTVSYNKDTKCPNWVAWHLTKAHTYGKVQRQEQLFTEDKDVPEPRATDDDYFRSAYDRGHMCPAGDNKWDEKAMEESFLLSNICPQNHNLNKYEWNDVEILCRAWAREYGSVDIVCGPVFNSEKARYTRRGGVRVPDAFFKVVLCRQSGAKAIGFLFENKGSKVNIYDRIRSVDEIEKITGINFFPALDDPTEQEVEASSDIREWKPSRVMR